jgi:hypothetical protein
MLSIEVIESEARLAATGRRETFEMNVTQRTIYNILVDFGTTIAKRADQQECSKKSGLTILGSCRYQKYPHPKADACVEWSSYSVSCRACGQDAIWCSVYTSCSLNKGKAHDLHIKMA